MRLASLTSLLRSASQNSRVLAFPGGDAGALSSDPARLASGLFEEVAQVDSGRISGGSEKGRNAEDLLKRF